MNEIAPTIYALDLDELTLNTGAVFNKLVSLYDSEGLLDAAIVHDARAKVEASGGSFDTDGFYKAQGIPDEERERISQILGDNEDGEDFLYPDSHDMLEALDETGKPYLTVTWGAYGTQMPKLRATKLDKRPYLITDIKSKGALIDTWRQPEGYYQVTATAGQLLVARSVLLLDDKAKSFDGLPEDCRGYLVQRRAPKPSQMGEVPSNVITLRGLAPVTQELRAA